MLPSKIESKYGAYMHEKWSELYLTVPKNNLPTCYCERERVWPASIHKGGDLAIQTERHLRRIKFTMPATVNSHDDVPPYVLIRPRGACWGMRVGCAERYARFPRRQNGGEGGGRKERGGMGIIWWHLIYIQSPRVDLCEKNISWKEGILL